ncbi:hypothetical protein QMK50_27160 [Pseudomonas sp. P5_152]|uniref:hypothetical protein n=1 Tax=Pseudomonas sp. P5_152 TaxID=3043442 RepID=UPI002A36EA6A|nr:hypothetical protein [Pseudomonas sp. P5_152]MDX9668629.1 hypothetical protein [Pseudomonas sp. P5_152]
MQKLIKVARCRYHELCAGWCETFEQGKAGVCENCLDETPQRAELKRRIILALAHLKELIDHDLIDKRDKVVVAALVGQLLTLGHIDVRAASKLIARLTD